MSRRTSCTSRRPASPPPRRIRTQWRTSPSPRGRERRRGALPRLRLCGQRYGLSVDREESLAPLGLAPPVVLRERRGEGGAVADEGVRHEEALRALRGDLGERERVVGPGEDLVR